MTRRVFITGTAGFIGYHLAQLLLDEGMIVHGYDGVTDYYDVTLKRRRHDMLHRHARFTRDRGDARGSGRARCRDRRLCP